MQKSASKLPAASRNSAKSPLKTKGGAKALNGSSMFASLIEGPMALQDKLDASVLREQDKDIEIERLQTTCHTLNAKSQIIDDLHNEIEMYKKRLAENEEQLKIAREENQV